MEKTEQYDPVRHKWALDVIGASQRENNIQSGRRTPKGDNTATFPEKIALIHSEVSEALESWREGAVEEDLMEELADIIIRVCEASSDFWTCSLDDAVSDKLKLLQANPNRHMERKI